jgi:hypothetical protein
MKIKAIRERLERQDKDKNKITDKVKIKVKGVRLSKPQTKTTDETMTMKIRDTNCLSTLPLRRSNPLFLGHRV